MNRQFTKRIRRLEELPIELADECVRNTAAMALVLYGNAHSVSAHIWRLSHGLVRPRIDTPYHRLSRELYVLQHDGSVTFAGQDARRLRRAAQYVARQVETIEVERSGKVIPFTALDKFVGIGDLL